jgi:hypothetical protein
LRQSVAFAPVAGVLEGVLFNISGLWVARWIAAVVFLVNAGLSPASAQSIAQPFDPGCGWDAACVVWAKFRNEHPFPHQTIAIAKTASGTLAVILSEPAYNLGKSKLQQLVRTAFGRDLLQYSDRRWMTGVDGWVEDAVLDVKWGAQQAALSDPLQDRLLRDRLALLEKALYGTAFGGFVEHADARLADFARSAAPNIAPTPGELHDWVGDPSVSWTSVDAGDGTPTVRLKEILAHGPAGAYVDQERQLAIFVLPHDVLEAARNGGPKMAELRIPFRRFAASTDVILGGVWDRDGSIALIGRTRRQPMTALQPLRFETFTILARESSGELQQSYERTNLFAGKLSRGTYRARDWAPIYLSKSLIDTEFGALLNVTDQLLKSWSQAGQIEYLYFNYPLRPARDAFVFGSQPLNEIVKRETGGTSVLFNWNTAGAAVQVHYPELNVLAVGKTGALPVTYGSEVLGGDMQTGDKLPKLRLRENAAYDYFAAQRDPNLSRVVSYTVLYQVFQAAQKNNKRATSTELADKRAKSSDILAAYAEQLLRKYEDGGTSSASGQTDAKRSMLTKFYAQHGSSRTRLASIMTGSDRNRSRMAGVNNLIDSFNQRSTAYSRRLVAFNADVDLYNNPSHFLTPSSRRELELRLTMERAELEAIDKQLRQEKEELEPQIKRAQEDLKAEAEEAADAHRLSSLLSPVLQQMTDLEEVRDKYVQANNGDPAGRIKTPSIVISWSTANLNSVGGHNLTARTFRIEVDPNARVLELKGKGDGAVLSVPPEYSASVTARAHDIARKLEHEAGTVEDVRALIASAPSKPSRTKLAALGDSNFNLRKLDCGLGCADAAEAAALGDAPAVRQDLTSYLSQIADYCCAIMRDAQGYIVGARRVKGLVECCVRFADAAKAQEFVERAVDEGGVLVIGPKDDFLDSIVESAQRDDMTVLATALGNGGGSWLPPRPPGPGVSASGDGFSFFGSGRKGGGGRQGGGSDGFNGGSGGGRGTGSDGFGGGSKGGGFGEGPSERLTVEFGARDKVLESSARQRDFSKVEYTEVGKDDLKAVLAEMADRPPLELGEDAHALRFNFSADVRSPADVYLVAAFEKGASEQGTATLKEAASKVRNEKSQMNLRIFHSRVKAFVEAKKDRGGVKWLRSFIKDGGLRFRIVNNRLQLKAAKS